MGIWTLVLSLVALAGLIAYAGDIIGRRVGRRHVRILGLRPRASALLIAVLAGMLIALIAFFAFFFLATDARRTILEAEPIRIERDKLRVEVTQLEGQISELTSKAARLFAQRENLGSDRQRLEKALNLAQFNLANAQKTLEQLKQEKKQLTQEVEQVRKQLAKREVTLLQVEAGRSKADRELLNLQKAQENLLAEIKQLSGAKSQAVSNALSAQDKLAGIYKEISLLQVSRNQLLGDLSVLAAERSYLEKSRDTLLQQNQHQAAQLDAAQLDEQNLRQNLASLQQQQEHLNSGLKALRQSLARLLSGQVLAEVPLEPSRVTQDISEALDQADLKVRLDGLGGVIGPSIGELKVSNWSQPGIVQVTSKGLANNGMIMVTVHYVPTRRVFTEGQVIALVELPPPHYQSERVRERLLALREEATKRLLAEGVLTNRVQAGQISGESLAAFQGTLANITQNVVVGVVSLNNVYTTHAPKLTFQVLYLTPALFEDSSPAN